MCGIFAYIGKEDDGPLRTLKGLKELEYRGYDSWGIALQGEESLEVRKSVGKISGVPESDFQDVKSALSIGHSRWATHGGVSIRNAHPHLSHDGKISVVHNGIIENHQELKLFLVKVYEVPFEELFVSETDTEVIPHLISYFMTQTGGHFEDAVRECAKRLEGRFAFVALSQEDEYLMAVRDGSPLVIGEEEHGYSIASDVPAFLDRTNRVCYLEDRHSARISRSTLLVRNIDTGKKKDQEFVTVEWDKSSASKEGYPHFMLKEIMEQSESLDRAIRQDERELNDVSQLLKKHTAYFLGCGTAAKVALVGQYFLAEISNTSVQSFIASEDMLYRGVFDKKTVLLAVSQSGETADTLETLETAKRCGAKIVSLLNVVGSSMYRISDRTLMLNSGPEKAVASTKAATAQIAILLLLAHAVSGKLGEGKHLLRGVVRQVKHWLSGDTAIDIGRIAKRIMHENDIYIIGRGANFPIALESAIKIQEVSYIHAEGFAGGELKHGPIALLRAGTPCIAFIANDQCKKDMESNISEIKSRGAFVIGISPENHKMFDEWIPVPDVGCASPIVNIIPVQLLAYHLAILRGNDPDMPRNLAKSVTVK